MFSTLELVSPSFNPLIPGLIRAVIQLWLLRKASIKIKKLFFTKIFNCEKVIQLEGGEETEHIENSIQNLPPAMTMPLIRHFPFSTNILFAKTIWGRGDHLAQIRWNICMLIIFILFITISYMVKQARNPGTSFKWDSWALCGQYSFYFLIPVLFKEYNAVFCTQMVKANQLVNKNVCRPRVYVWASISFEA